MTRAVGKKMPGHKRLRIHCTHALPEVLSLWPLRWRFGKRIGIICYVHGEEITACRSSRQLRPMLNRAFKLADLLLANSQYTAELAREHADPAKIRIVHPGVQITEFDDAAQLGDAFRKENNLQDRLIVLTLGRLDPRKNQMAVLNAIATLAGHFANLVYIIAGEGRQADLLKERARALGIEGRVRFTGPVDGRMKRALFGCCDVFAMPAVKVGTDVEGFGIVFLEAGACNKPALAGRSGGQADAVEDGRSGLIVDGHDAQAVTAALKKLLADADLRKRMGQAGREKALGHDWARVVQRTVELVEEIQSA